MKAGGLGLIESRTDERDVQGPAAIIKNRKTTLVARAQQRAGILIIQEIDECSNGFVKQLDLIVIQSGDPCGLQRMPARGGIERRRHGDEDLRLLKRLAWRAAGCGVQQV